MRYLILFSFLLFGFVGCVDRDFDAPPLDERVDPDIPADQIISIAELKALRDNNEFTAIQLDRYISAVIVADDESGNFFRTIVLEDETGGISILLDDVELWNRYFVGNRVFIHLERIWLGEFAGLPQIGFEPFLDDSNRLSMARIPSIEIPNVVILGAFAGSPQGRVTTIAQLSDDDLNTLVTIENAEFSTGSAGAPYADSAGSRAVNHTLTECNGGSIIVRSSGFSNFADALTPTGGGSITAIYGVFNSDKQLLIRDLDDVAMEGSRCDGSGGGGGSDVEIDPDKVVSISSILDQWVPGEETVLGTDEFIRGVVVSSDETGNIFKTLTIQDGTTGIAILVDAFDIHINYTLGTEVFVHLQDLFIADFSGLPQLGYSPSGDNVRRIPEGLVSSIILKSGDSELVEPISTSIADLTDGQLNTLIEIDEIQFIDSDTGRTFADGANNSAYNATLEDCDGNQLTLRTSGFADYANDRIPSENGRIRGLLQVFDGAYQLALNFPENINFSSQRCDGSGGGGGNDDDVFQTNFEDQADFDNLNLNGWLNIATQGDRVWIKRSFSGNGFAEVTAFQDANPNTEAWLISPEVITAERSELSFISATAFFRHDGLEVLYSSNFDGTNVSNATWNMVDVTLAGSSNEDYEWVSSERVDLTQYGSNIHIAFRYTGTSGGNTSTFRIDDLSIN
jgi:hypothetical protein